MREVSLNGTWSLEVPGEDTRREGDFPHERLVGAQFHGLATDLALDTRAVPRLDARTAAVHDYAVEVGHGDGKLIVSTLRFEGGLGDQPLGVARNTSAAYLLSRWVRWLGDKGPDPE